jgi:hypothetical protein
MRLSKYLLPWDQNRFDDFKDRELENSHNLQICRFPGCLNTLHVGQEDKGLCGNHESNTSLSITDLSVPGPVGGAGSGGVIGKGMLRLNELKKDDTIWFTRNDNYFVAMPIQYIIHKIYPYGMDLKFNDSKIPEYAHFCWVDIYNRFYKTKMEALRDGYFQSIVILKEMGFQIKKLNLQNQPEIFCLYRSCLKQAMKFEKAIIMETKK